MVAKYVYAVQQGYCEDRDLVAIYSTLRGAKAYCGEDIPWKRHGTMWVEATEGAEYAITKWYVEND